MIKLIGIFRKIEDMEAFKEQFFRDWLPKMLQVSGVIGVKISTMLPMSSNLAQDVEGIQLVIESCFESKEAIDRIVYSGVAQSLLETVSQLPGELSVYIGQEKTYSLADFQG